MSGAYGLIIYAHAQSTNRHIRYKQTAVNSDWVVKTRLPSIILNKNIFFQAWDAPEVDTTAEYSHHWSILS